MLATRFICARKSWHVDHRGEIRQRRVVHGSFDSTQGAHVQQYRYTQFKRAIDMTDDELAAIASGATLHVVK